MPLPSLAESGRAALRYRPRKLPQPLSSEEQETLLGRGMHALGWFAEAIDKPRRAVAGSASFLSGGPAGGGLKNLIPFSDMMGFTDPKETVYAGDLMARWGWLPENVEGLEDWGQDILRFIGDVAMDPLIWIAGPGRALTKTGVAALGKGGVKEAKHVKQYVLGAIETGDPAKWAAKGLPKNWVPGSTPAAMADEIRAGARGFLAIKVPFAKKPFMVFGTGETSAKLIEALNYGTFSPVPYLRNLFSTKVGGVALPIGRGVGAQQAADRYFTEMLHISGALDDSSRAMMGATDEVARMFDDAKKHLAETGDKFGFKDFDEFQRIALERNAHYAANTKEMAGQIRHLFKGAPSETADTFNRQFAMLNETMYEIKDALYNRYLDLGGVGDLIDDMYIGQFPRRAGGVVAKRSYDEMRNIRLFDPTTPFASARKPHYRHVPLGSFTVNHMAMDPWLTATAGKVKSKQFQEGLLGELAEYMEPSDLAALKGASSPALQEQLAFHRYLKPAGLTEGLDPVADFAEFSRLEVGLDRKIIDTVTPGKAEELLAQNRSAKSPLFKRIDDTHVEQLEHAGQAKLLADHLRGLPEEVLNTGIFNRRSIDDYADYTRSLTLALSNLRAGHSFVRQAVQEIGPKPIKGMIPLRHAWELVTSKQGKGKRLLDDRGLDRFITEYAEENAEFAAKHLPGKPNRATLDAAIDALEVHEEIPNIFSGYIELSQRGPSTFLGQLWDDYTAAAKAGFTTLFPAFHVRNLTDGMFRNYCAASPERYSPWGLSKGARDMFRLLTGRRGGADEYVPELLNNGMLRGAKGELADVFGETAGAVPSLLDTLKVLRPSFWAKAGEKQVYGRKLSALNFFTNVRGTRTGAKRVAAATAKGQVARQNVAAELGQTLYTNVEAVVRGAPYIALRRKGYSPSQAAHLVNMVQYDYSLAGKRVNQPMQKFMRRVFPFWGFISQNIPYQMSQLFNKPGGGHAQTLRFIARLHSEGGQDLPNFLRMKASVRLPGPEHEATVVRQLGLSLEDLSTFQFLQNGHPDFVATFMKASAQAHPFIKLPAEAWAQKEFYTGRKWSELRSVQFGPVVVPEIISRMIRTVPYFSRSYDTVRAAGDVRKSPGVRALDLLTGVKVGAYDLPKLRMYEARNLLQREAEKSPHVRMFQQPYIPKHVRAKLEPEQLAVEEGLLAGQKRLSEAIQAYMARQPAK